MKVGDVVQLKSDDVRSMTVEKLAEPGTVASVAWFDADFQLHRDEIPVDALEVID